MRVVRALAALVGTLALMPGAAAAAVTSAPPNVPVTLPVPPTHAYNEPSLASDPARPGHLAIGYEDTSDNYQTCYVALSNDDGRTWRNIALAGANAVFPVAPNPADISGAPWTTECRYPLVTFGPDGTLYYCYEHGFGSAPTIDLVVSLDGGTTWALHHPDALYYQLPYHGASWTPAMTVDPRSGTLYIARERCDVDYDYRPARIEVVSSGDRGRTFSTPAIVTAPTQQAPLTPALTVGVDGTLFVGWIDATEWMLTGDGAAVSPSWQLYTAASKDKGASFTMTLADPNVGSVCCDARFGGDGYNRLAPALLGGSRPGQVYLAYWYSPTATPHQFRLHLATSSDSGGTWTPPRTLAPPGQTDDQQHRPSLALTPDGALDMVYYDTDPKGMQDTYFISSADRGASFSPPLRLSSVSSDTTNAAPGWSGKMFGNFIGVDARGSEIRAAWTDMRRGTRESAHEDVYFASWTAADSSGLAAPSGLGTPSITAPNTGAAGGGEAPFVAAALGLAILRARPPRAVRTPQHWVGGAR